MATTISVINSMLATTGTARLSQQDDTHPEYIRAEDVLNDVLEEFGSTALWFNTAIRTLRAASDGTVVVPSDATSCDPTDSSKNYVIRGQRLFDLENNTDVISEDVECLIVYRTELSDMPPAAVQYVRAAARARYFMDVDGDANKAQGYIREAEGKLQNLMSDSLARADINFFTSPAGLSFYTRRYPGGSNGYGGRIKVR